MLLCRNYELISYYILCLWAFSSMGEAQCAPNHHCCKRNRSPPQREARMKENSPLDKQAEIQKDGAPGVAEAPVQHPAETQQSADDGRMLLTCQATAQQAQCLRTSQTCRRPAVGSCGRTPARPQCRSAADKAHQTKPQGHPRCGKASCSP